MDIAFEVASPTIKETRLLNTDTKIDIASKKNTKKWDLQHPNHARQ